MVSYEILNLWYTNPGAWSGKSVLYYSLTDKPSVVLCVAESKEETFSCEVNKGGHYQEICSSLGHI